MKKLVMQVNIPNEKLENKKKLDIFSYIEEMYFISNQMAKKYADRVGADYYLVSKSNDWKLGEGRHPAYQKLKVYDFIEYDAILYIDSDYIIKDNAPDVFQLFGNNVSAVLQNEAGAPYLEKLKISAECFPNTGFVYYTKEFLDYTRQYLSDYMKKEWELCDQGLLGTLIYNLNLSFNKLNSEDWNSDTVFGTYGDHYGGRGKKKWGSVKYL
jgi:alpha-N-acetylglucosamine transferase